MAAAPYSGGGRHTIHCFQGRRPIWGTPIRKVFSKILIPDKQVAEKLSINAEEKGSELLSIALFLFFYFSVNHIQIALCNFYWYNFQ